MELKNYYLVRNTDTPSSQNFQHSPSPFLWTCPPGKHRCCLTSSRLPHRNLIPLKVPPSKFSISILSLLLPIHSFEPFVNFHCNIYTSSPFPFLAPSLSSPPLLLAHEQPNCSCYLIPMT